ncbi:MAG: glutamate synthase [Actinomycetota bacterium]|nr:glutamate synthase [Actinomycetota bacterium]MDA3007996.1 glutamate synthase [Actinomycetota bacterium]MDA3035535.1 glutamate synthase [Actinomycetota bacterium]
MSDDTAPLTPMPLRVLAGRIAHEWSTRSKIFDLPNARIWRPDADIDLGIEFLGRPCATPIGPAAGPHSQMAQNLVLAWLGGSRLFELKTVQVIDDLEIARPCIDMETIGYNTEWSQELSVPASIDEYVGAALLIAALSRWEPLAEHLGPDPGRHVFDMSVGYDLAGISTNKVAGFISTMRNASAVIERMRTELASVPAMAHLADVDLDPCIADTLTLSTFHGCPPDEIHAIVTHLIDVHDLDVIVKLNPTLLGIDTVTQILHDELGYRDLQLRQSAFDDDLTFDRGIELIEDLSAYAAARGHRFGIKLTNTMVVGNHRGLLGDDPMYMSGPPLHVLASTLCDRLATALPGRLAIPGHDGDIMVSFSAGVTRSNLADTLAMGANPATICSDLLKPGGYGRLAPMLRDLAGTIAADGCADLTSWRAHRQEAAVAEGYASSCARHVAHIRSDGIEAYHLDGNSKLPRSVDHDLDMFGCVACNFCITVCPNDAFFSIRTPDGSGLEARQQYLVYAELCNECGNCLGFCPERGDPAMIKPRLFTDPELFAAREGQGFLVIDGAVVDYRGDEDSARIVGDLLASPTGDPLGGAGR